MLARMGISRKLAVMLAVPLAGLVFFSGASVLQMRRISTEMQLVERLTHLAVAVGDLVHELQKERGLSAGHLGSGGARFGAELVAQRASTDQKLDAYRGEATSLQGGKALEELREALARADEALGGLRARRDAVTARTTDPDPVVDYYSRLNATLLEVVPLISRSTTEASLVNPLVAYFGLAHFKEAMGIERALLNDTFSRDAFRPGFYEQFVSSRARQESHLDLFRTYSAGAHRDLLRRELAGDDVAEVSRLESLALARSAEGGFAVDPAHWWRVMTGKIDLLKEIEGRIAADLLALADEAQATAERTLSGYLLLSALAVAVAAALGFLMARAISTPLTASGLSAREIAAQIVASSQQQSATTNETATAASQTSTTVEQIRQTSEMTAEKARRVAELADRSAASVSQANGAIEQNAESMTRIRAEVEGIARNILDLSERNIRIGEIVQSVNAIAEQSNLLAVNASIEAAKAGEHGKGFAVVASEVKALAGQSRDATQQIRALLGEIQKSSNGAVMVTEQGVKRVEEGSRLVDELRHTVQALAETIQESADAASQIALASNQQLTGVQQITGAMRDIEQATRENAAGARQLEQVAAQVEAVSGQLQGIVTGAAA